MPNLLKKTDDGWHIAEQAVAPGWQDSDQWQAGQPLRLDGDAEADAAFVEASAIAIDFPAFTDGRGLSLAVMLRTRLQFKGELWARGALLEETLHYLVRCGFDCLELPADTDPHSALLALTPYSEQYQASVTQPEPAFRRVNRGSTA